MATIIRAYDYIYGSGDQINRQIQFSRTGLGAETIQARVLDLNAPGGVTHISTILGNQISIEMQSSAEKTNAKAQERITNVKAVSVPDKILSTLSTIQQDGLLQQLAPSSNSISGSGRKIFTISPIGHVELVSSLKIYDPS